MISAPAPAVKSDGISILPTLLGKPQTQQHAELYGEFSEGAQAAPAIRTADWKAVYDFKRNLCELYATTDEAEAHDVAAMPPEIVAQLKARRTANHTAHPQAEGNPP